jgi:hypothetical protein
VSFDLVATHATILSSLQNGGRGLVSFAAQDLPALKLALKSTDEVQKHQAIMVCAHLSHPQRELEDSILALMQTDLSAEDHIWLLNALRRNVLQGRFKDGERLTQEILEALRKKLYHRDLSVVEWALRTVEECGAQGIVFRGDLAKIKPSFWKLWQAQSRTVLELVTFLERRWSEKP